MRMRQNEMKANGGNVKEARLIDADSKQAHHGIAADCAMGGTAIKPQAPGPNIMLFSSLTAISVRAA